MKQEEAADRIEDAITAAVNDADGLSAFAIHTKARRHVADLQTTIDMLRSLARRGLIRFVAGMYLPRVGTVRRKPSAPRAAILTNGPPSHMGQEDTTMAQKPTTQEAILAVLPAEPADVIKRTRLPKQAIYSAASVMKKSGLIKKAGKQWVRADGKAGAAAAQTPPRGPVPVPEFLKPTTKDAEMIASLRAQAEYHRKRAGQYDAAVSALEALTA